MKFYLAKQGNKFIPSTQEDQIKAYKIPQGHVVECKSMKQRNYQFLKKYWKLVAVTLQNLPEAAERELMEKHQFQIKSKEDLHFYLKLKGGYVEKKFIDKSGNIGWAVKSVSFDKMDSEEFDRFFSDALDNCAQLLTVESDELMNEVLQFT